MTDYEKDAAQAREDFNKEVREFLETQTVEELSYILGRYCGRHNYIISEKKFGYHMPEKLVQEVFNNKVMERALFGEETKT